MGKKIPVSVILRRADEVATIAGISREEAVEALKIAHERLGYEVDLGTRPTSNGTVLDFTESNKPELTKTQVLPKIRQDWPLQA